MRIIKNIVTILSILLILTSCSIIKNESVSQSSILVSSTQENISSDVPKEKNVFKPLSLLEVYPKITHITQYDDSNLLIMQPDKISLFNVSTLTKGGDIPVSFSVNHWIKRLSDNMFYYKDSNKIVILDKELKEVKQFTLPESIENNVYAIAPSGQSIAYLLNNYHLMYLPDGANKAIDLGEITYDFIYLDDLHIVAANTLNEETSYQIIDLDSGDRTTFNTTAIFPLEVKSDRLLLTEAWLSGELPHNNIVRITNAKYPFDSFMDIKMHSLGESGSVTLSDNGRYALSYLSNYDLSDVPVNSVQFSMYSTKTGKKLWSKIVTTNQENAYARWPIYFESSNTIAYTISEDSEDYALSDAYVLHLDR